MKNLLLLVGIIWGSICAAQDSLASGKIKLKFIDPSTQLKVYGTYLNGKRNGTFEYRDSTGSVVLREHFTSGQFEWAVFYKNGKWMMTRNKKGKVVKRAACGC